MARIIGGIGTSHVPSIGAALDKGLRDSADWKPFFDGYEAGKDWMREARPDIAVVIFNDQHEVVPPLTRTPEQQQRIESAWEAQDRA